MHRQRTFLSLATSLCSLSIFLKWMGNDWFYFSGLHFGISGKMVLLFYVAMLIVTIIDLTDRALSKKRLVVMMFVTLCCFTLMLTKFYPAFARLNIRDQHFGIIGIGFVLFVCSNLFMLGYCIFSYKRDYILPEKDDTVLDN